MDGLDSFNQKAPAEKEARSYAANHPEDEVVTICVGATFRAEPVQTVKVTKS